MAAVGLSDVFKYGGTFLGYLVAVAVASVVFVGGGAYFATTGGLNVLSPSIHVLTTGRAIGSAVLVVLGVLISLSGLIGLLHKLLADAAAAALASARAADQGVAAAQDADATDEDKMTEETPAEGSADADAPADGDEPAVAENGEETPLDGEDTTGTVTEEPEPGRPVDDATPAQEPPVADGKPESRPASGANSVAKAAADHGDASPPRETPPAPPDQTTGDQVAEPTESGDFVDESATDYDWTESKYATGTQATGDDDDLPQEDATGAVAQESADDGADGDTPRTEWTPPDPAEFGQISDSSEESVSEQTQPEPSGSTPESTSDEVVREAQSSSQSEEDIRTWDDVQSASSGNGIESEDPAADATDDTVGANEPNFADDQPSAASKTEDATSMGSETDEGVGDEADQVDDVDEDEADLTLADEGVSSFNPEADDDPLGDRLSGGDD